MEAREAMKEIRSGAVRPVYVAYGKDRYRMMRFAAFMEETLLKPDERELGVVKMDTAETPLEEVVAEAETPPFFVSRKIIFVKDQTVFAAGGKENGKVTHRTDALLEYLKRPAETSVIVFLVQADKLDERRKLVKSLKSDRVLIPFEELGEHELKQWIVRRAAEQNREISEEAAELLLSRTGNHMQQLASEVDKLCLYAGSGGRIGRGDVELLTASTVEEDVFALIDHIAGMETDKALGLYRRLLGRREEPIKLLALIARQYRIMLQVKELERHSYSPQQMAGQLGLHPYAVKLAADKARRYNVERLGELLSALADLDYRMKTGRIDKELGLELFLLSAGCFRNR